MRTGWMIVGAFLTVFSSAWAGEVAERAETQTVSVKYYCTRGGTSEFPYPLKYVVVSSTGATLDSGTVMNYREWESCLLNAKNANASAGN